MTWDIDPELIRLGPLGIRYYGLMFVIGFTSMEFVVKRIFKSRGLDPNLVSSLTLHIFGGTFIGARLAHCFFYSPEYYLSNPLDILKVWEGGLASHGGFAGVIIATYIFFKKHKDQLKFFWLMDVISGPCLFVGSLIRIGNFFNSEIVGRPTDLPWGIVFAKVDTFARHPAQLYESLGYFTISMILFSMYRFRFDQWKKGYILCNAIMISFGFRFFIEFVKDNQSTISDGFAINMGQILSLMFMSFGAFLFWKIRNSKES